MFEELENIEEVMWKLQKLLKYQNKYFKNAFH
jgi:hypothetical protein